jgi:flagellar M-ring protein FliF
VASLDRQRVPYRLAANGTQILVPAEDVPRLRLSLAREGLPSGGSIGNEIFDRGESLTTTPFQQEMNRLRALEGELARSIRALQGVRAARVHLVLPRREAFSRERAEAQASVLLTMQGVQRLDREGVQAVLHLVVTAVSGLRPQNVSIVDSRGELLARGGQPLTGPAGAQTQDELRRGQEARLARGVEEMLERVLGAGRVRAEVAMEMDFDRVETREERFDPDNQVARSTQSTTENNRTQEPSHGQRRQQPAGRGATGWRQWQHREQAGGDDQLRDRPLHAQRAARASGGSPPDGRGAGGRRHGVAVRRPAGASRAHAGGTGAHLRLVRNAVGFNEQRGDRVEVVSMRFAEAETATRETGPLGLDISQATLARLMETAVIGLLILLTLLLVARPVAQEARDLDEPDAGPGGRRRRHR